MTTTERASVARPMSTLLTGGSLAPTIALQIRLVDESLVKTVHFHPGTLVFDALKIIRDKAPTLAAANARNNGNIRGDQNLR